MSLSVQDFAAQLPALRPQLHATLQRRFPCQPADAEDLVETAICDALEKLSLYDPDRASVATWLTGFLLVLIARSPRPPGAPWAPPSPLPLDAAAEIPDSARQVDWHDYMERQARRLPDSQFYIVRAWMDGDSIKSIALDHDLSRNTVSARLHEAFRAMRADIPAAEYLTFTMSEFDFCRRVVIYHKPGGSYGRWARSHPPDVAFKRDSRTRSGFAVRKAA